jgi:hypothetical protein
MAENKKSFLAYCDWIDVFEELTDEEAGKLAKHLFRYVNDKNPELDDRLLKLSFIPIQQTLKRDLKKYEKYVDKQRENGSKGGRPKKEETQITQPFFQEPKKADSDSDSDIVSVNAIVNESVNVIENNNLKISSILSFFEFSIDNPYHSKQKSLVLAFLTVLKDHDYFFKQFEAYKKVKENEIKYRHKLPNFLGSQSERFEDGKWLDENWIQKLNNLKSKKEDAPQAFSLAERNRAKRLAEQNQNKNG